MIDNYELTVKHVHDGVAHLYPTNKVRVTSSMVSFPIRPDDMVWQEIGGGSVYIMNSTGKTVDSYHFDGPQMPVAI